MLNIRQEPQWHGSDAEKLLKKDVEDGIHDLLSPMDFYYFWDEYQVY